MWNLDEVLAKGAMIGRKDGAPVRYETQSNQQSGSSCCRARKRGHTYSIRGEKGATRGLTIVHSALNKKFSKRIKNFYIRVFLFARVLEIEAL